MMRNMLHENMQTSAVDIQQSNLVFLKQIKLFTSVKSGWGNSRADNSISKLN